jgi:hypothetical protein
VTPRLPSAGRPAAAGRRVRWAREMSGIRGEEEDEVLDLPKLETVFGEFTSIISNFHYCQCRF